MVLRLTKAIYLVSELAYSCLVEDISQSRLRFLMTEDKLGNDISLEGHIEARRTRANFDVLVFMPQSKLDGSTAFFFKIRRLSYLAFLCKDLPCFFPFITSFEVVLRKD